VNITPEQTTEPSLGYPLDALPVGKVLGQYTIVSMLGRGSFGITYLAKEAHLDQFVAIKEYLPQGYAVRSDKSKVHSLPGDKAEIFNYGRERFLDEAKTLRRFKHPNIVRVLTYFEKFNTAYFVMEFEVGSNLKSYLEQHPHPTEQKLINLFVPILSGLAEIHGHGYIHRDIKPQNIYIREDGSPVLLDFGTARDVVNVRSDQLTRILTEGYAPYEQVNPEWGTQGPWTDIYALGATLHYAIVGEVPVDSQKRAFSCLTNSPDPYIPLSGSDVKGYSLAFLKAVDSALAFLPEQRPKSVTAWCNILCESENDGATIVKQPPDTQSAPLVRTGAVAAHESSLQEQIRESRKRRWPPVMLALSIVIVVAAGIYWGKRYEEESAKSIGKVNSNSQVVVIDRMAEEKGIGTPENVPVALTGSAFILAKTSAWHLSRAARIEKLIQQISSLPATSDRTRFIVDQQAKLDEAKRGAAANLARYTEAIEQLKHYDPELVEIAVRSFLDKPEYTNDLTYQELAKVIEEHLAGKVIENDQLQRDLVMATEGSE
jgi:serine/threonine protein kinase